MHPDATYLARQYCTILDHHGYDTFRDFLGPELVQHRGDMTFSGRGEFVTFIRDDRPQKDTRHVIERYVQSKPDDEIVVCDHLEDGDGNELLIFLDRFRAHDGRLSELKTFVKSSTTD